MDVGRKTMQCDAMRCDSMQGAVMKWLLLLIRVCCLSKEGGPRETTASRRSGDEGLLACLMNNARQEREWGGLVGPDVRHGADQKRAATNWR